MVKVSIVLPVYNVEDYLPLCLDSLINQTLKDIEIICVNDGSTDNSLNILNEYSKKDSRIKVLTQGNGGHAAATNNGMDFITGEYVFLMDSDDILRIFALEELYDYAEKMDVDFVIFKAINYIDDENRYYESEMYNMDAISKFSKHKPVFNYKDLDDLIFKISVTPWSKIYKADYILKHNFRFPEGLIFDDNVFFWDILFNAEKIAFYDKHLFIRRWYTSSSTTSGDIRFLDSITINNMVIDKFKEYGEFDKFKKNLYNQKINLGYFRFKNIKLEFKKTFFETLKEDFQKNILDVGLYEDYIQNLNERNKKILDSCLNSDNYEEFHQEIKKYDQSGSK